MSVIVPDDLPGVAEANAELDRLMAAEQSEAEAGQEQTARSTEQPAGKATDSGKGQDRAGQQGTKTAQEETETPADQAKSKEQAAAGSQKPGDKPADGKEPSRYQKARERQEKSWNELNAQKETLKREREEFDRQRTEHQQRMAQAEKEFSPEEYEKAADKFEKAGKFDLAEAARERAVHLRKNPPQAKTGEDPASASREWALKAGVDFPDLAKANSPLQQRVAQLLKEEPEFKAHPKGIYLAARLASLEGDLAGAKAAAASVSVKDKEITQLKSRIKELEEATAPGNGGAAALPAAKDFSEKSDAEQFEELQQMARETGALR